MFFVSAKLFSFLLSPLTWIVALLLIAIIFKSRSFARKCFVAAIFITLIFTNPYLSDKALNAWEISTYNIDSIKKQFDVAIVLGGSTGMYDENAQRITYSQSVDRLIEATLLYRAGKVKKLLLSGGSGFVSLPELKEAELLKAVLLQMRIDSNDIIIENESRNTYENALCSSKLLKTGRYGKSFVVITSAIHIRRSLACFKKQNLEVTPFPVDKRSGFGLYTPDRLIVPSAWSLIQWEALLHEMAGFIIYKLQGFC